MNTTWLGNLLTFVQVFKQDLTSFFTAIVVTIFFNVHFMLADKSDSRITCLLKEEFVVRFFKLFTKKNEFKNSIFTKKKYGKKLNSYFF